MVQQFVREIAKTAGFAGHELEQIDVAIEESVSNIMLHASDEENPTFDVICEKTPGGIRIVLKEMGIPFDPAQIRKYELTGSLDEISTAGLGIYLIQKMMDELKFNNLGPEGKETVMIKYLPGTTPAEKESETEKGMKEPPILAEKIEYSVRGLEEHEAIEVSRCAYKTHGYTFFDDHIYYSERAELILEMLMDTPGVQLARAEVFDHAHFLKVHAQDYLEYLQNAYDEWIADGLWSEGIMPEFFPIGRMRDKPPGRNPIGRAGYYMTDSCTMIVKGTWEAAIMRNSLPQMCYLSSVRSFKYHTDEKISFADDIGLYFQFFHRINPDAGSCGQHHTQTSFDNARHG